MNHAVRTLEYALKCCEGCIEEIEDEIKMYRKTLLEEEARLAEKRVQAIELRAALELHRQRDFA